MSVLRNDELQMTATTKTKRKVVRSFMMTRRLVLEARSLLELGWGGKISGEWCFNSHKATSFSEASTQVSSLSLIG